MKGKYIVFMLLLLGLSYFLYNPMTGDSGKSIVVTGKIVNKDNKPISEASILLQGTTVRTFSNDRGEYTIKGKTGGTFTVSHRGYRAQELPISGTKMDIILVRPDSAFNAHVDAIIDSLNTAQKNK